MESLTGSMENWVQAYPALNTVPSAADHVKMIEHLDQIGAGPVVEPDITKLHPSDLRGCFPLSSKYLPGTRAKEWETQHGPWKVKTGSFSVVLSEPGRLSAGAKRTMEFYQNGTATDWAMDQYFGLAYMMGRLVMEDDVTLCHVYQQKRKGPLTEKKYSAPIEDLGANVVIEGYDVDALLACLPPSFHENRTNQNHQAANNQEAAVRESANQKPKRKSDVWNDFTEVYVKDLDGNLKKEYAMCNFCHMLLIAPSSNGTNTLWKHTGSCRCKRQTQ